MMWRWHLFFDGKVAFDHQTGCVLWTRNIDELGYGRAGRTAGEVKTHRISFALAFGSIPDGMHVLHACDVRHCVNPHHLSTGTHADNMADCARKGRVVSLPRYGADNPMAALSGDDVYAIRCMLDQGLFNQAAIARSYGVAPMTVSRIASGQSWPHIGPNWPFDNGSVQ